ncbi:MAG: hypothetical protein ACRCSV_05000 [Chlamydiales bacterium]
MESNPILSDQLIRLDQQFIENITQIKEKYYSLNIMPCSGYGLAILKRYIEEIEKMAEYIFKDSSKDFHQIFSNIYLKKLKPKLISDLDSIQGTHQVDEVYERLLKRYDYEIKFSPKTNLILNYIKIILIIIELFNNLFKFFR